MPYYVERKKTTCGHFFITVTVLLMAEIKRMTDRRFFSVDFISS
jgi:hypothetical protein